ncbi:hemocytin-like [Glandiceps talaboti]
MAGSTTTTTLLLSVCLAMMLYQGVNSQVCGWTEWMDSENGGTVDPAGQGEFEIIQVLRNSYNICQENITDIECREVNSPNRPYNETGQIEVTCTTDSGLMCFHDKQEPAGTKCLNYEIRVFCSCYTAGTTVPPGEITPSLGTRSVIHSAIFIMSVVTCLLKICIS